MKMRRKGQIDQIITSLVVVFGVFVLMLVFVIVTSNVGAFTNKAEESYNFEDDNFLLQKADVNGVERLLFETIVLYWRGDVEINQLREILKQMLNEEKPCLLLAQGTSPSPAGQTGAPAINDFVLEYDDGEIISGHTGNKPLILREYDREGLLKEFSFFEASSDKRIYVQYYFGRCLE